MIVMGLLSILANIPLIHQFNYVKCNSFAWGRGIRAVVAEEACVAAYLWVYMAGFIVALNTLLPAVLQILMNAYIINVLCQLKRKKVSGNIGD